MAKHQELDFFSEANRGVNVTAALEHYETL